jgi:hypothetical protein
VLMTLCLALDPSSSGTFSLRLPGLVSNTISTPSTSAAPVPTEWTEAPTHQAPRESDPATGVEAESGEGDAMVSREGANGQAKGGRGPRADHEVEFVEEEGRVRVGRLVRMALFAAMACTVFLCSTKSFCGHR